ncbi:tlde1 domain-containing protein [Paraburkholderia sp. 40]|uniref:tlde1 domain-containing protein n=1 Tax=Paraburkholderia sp. 40 TaxID=2991059 RepID=UPI003D1C28BA
MSGTDVHAIVIAPPPQGILEQKPMTVSCTFELNRKETSRFVCSGFGAVEAYSGQRAGRDNPDNVADVDVGPIPPGTYYLIDRQSGGRIGGLGTLSVNTSEVVIGTNGSRCGILTAAT